MTYDDSYKNTGDYFGLKPTKLLVDWLDKLKSGLVLDIGAGQGRNTLFLAKQGYDVYAIDPSEVGIKTIEKKSKELKMPLQEFVHCAVGGFEAYDPQGKQFSTILLFGILQHLTPADIELLAERVSLWAKSGAYFFISAFTTQDPGFEDAKRNAKALNDHSFKSEEQGIQTYVDGKHLQTYFPQFDPIFVSEEWGEDHRHGDGPLERHHELNAVLKRL